MSVNGLEDGNTDDTKREKDNYRNGARNEKAEHDGRADRIGLRGIDYLNNKERSCADYVDNRRYVCYFWQNFVFHIPETEVSLTPLNRLYENFIIQMRFNQQRAEKSGGIYRRA